MSFDSGLLGVFHKGGIIMWPLLLTSVIAVGVAIERMIFIFVERKHRDPKVIDDMFACAERNDIRGAIKAGSASQDFVAKTLTYGLSNRDVSFANALLKAANKELKRFSQGLPILDTIITLAPLLGLLGTVTGMINAFGLLGNSQLDAPTAITGGIAEALIATAFGLGIAIVSLIPFNYLNARLEEARHEIEDASNNMEILLMKPQCKLITEMEKRENTVPVSKA